MKIFHDSDTWSGKINFVDDNNVLVGFDDGQCCCEHADWFFAREITKGIESNDFPSDNDETSEKLEGYNFDPNFYEYVDGVDLDSGGMVAFKLVNEETGGVAYLHLFNCHNGYYGHGFSMLNDGEVVHFDTL